MLAALACTGRDSHGRYKKPPKLDIGRIAAINEEVGIPLVLHGGSGIPDDQIRAGRQSRYSEGEFRNRCMFMPS